jgi:hypothetical protein
MKTAAMAQPDDPFPFQQPKQLFRNLGNGKFENVMAAVGVHVIRPDGRAEEWRGVAADRYTTLTEGTGTAVAPSRTRR